MTCHSRDVRITTMNWVAGVATLMVTLSCDSTGPEPKQVPAAPMVPIMRGQMVFVDQSASVFSIFLADSSGAKLKNLSLEGWDAFDPAVSADGNKIAYSSHVPNEDGRDIWVMNADGSNRVRLTHTVNTTSWRSSTSPAWSPDGKRIAFVTSTGVWEHQIFIMNADGSEVKQLTDDDNAYSLAPEWSPDGSRILFSRSPLHLEDAGIFEMNPDGSNVRQLTSGYFAMEPTRSPDATRIAFMNGQSLFVMNADGSNAAALASGLDWEGDLTWSPDGKSIVFGITSSSKMCLDSWDLSEYACGRDLKRVGLDGVIDPTWELLSAFSLVWQR
jgi:Tol biopolymer transport system component